MAARRHMMGRPRSSRRLGVGLAAGLLIGATLLLATRGSAAQAPQTLGSKSCVSECHASELDWWQNYDGSQDGYRHEQARERIYEPNAQKYASALGLSEGKDVDGACVQCHATVYGQGRARRPREGVSCESCHGPGGGYLERHDDTLEGEAARGERRQQSIADGLRPVFGDPANWAGLCFGCHIVAPGEHLTADQTDNLLRAGHPTGRDFMLEAKWGYVGHEKHWMSARARYVRAGAEIKAQWDPRLAALPPLPTTGSSTPGETGSTPTTGPSTPGETGLTPTTDPSTGGETGPTLTTDTTAQVAIPAELLAELQRLRNEVRSLRRVIDGIPTAGGAAPPPPDIRLTTPSTAPIDPLPQSPAASVAVVQGQLINLLQQLLEDEARAPIRVSPLQSTTPYSGAESELLALQEQVIALAIRALGISPTQDQDGQ